MNRGEIIDAIDRGANYYVELFGRAEHMEIVRREHYSFVRPKGDEYGIRFVYDLRLEGLPEERQRELAGEIKFLGMPVWLNLGSSEQVFRVYTGTERPNPPRELSPEDEVYMAMLPSEKPEYPAHPEVIEARTQEEFAQWAGVVNQVLSGGKEDLHPIYHYSLCQDGLLRCYMVRAEDGKAISAAAGAVDERAVSLEFVATLPEHRRQGLARAVSRRVVADAFRSGAEIVTVRAINGIAADLYRSIGFQTY